MVLGDFDDYASREEVENLEIIKRALPEAISAQFKTDDAPGLRNKVMIISIKPIPRRPREDQRQPSRDMQTDPASKYSAQKHGRQYEECLCKPHKPLAMRQMNAQVTLKADAIKKL